MQNVMQAKQIFTMLINKKRYKAKDAQEMKQHQPEVFEALEHIIKGRNSLTQVNNKEAVLYTKR